MGKQKDGHRIQGNTEIQRGRRSEKHNKRQLKFHHSTRHYGTSTNTWRKEELRRKTSKVHGNEEVKKKENRTIVNEDS